MSLGILPLRIDKGEILTEWKWPSSAAGSLATGTRLSGTIDNPSTALSFSGNKLGVGMHVIQITISDNTQFVKKDAWSSHAIFKNAVTNMDQTLEFTVKVVSPGDRSLPFSRMLNSRPSLPCHREALMKHAARMLRDHKVSTYKIKREGMSSTAHGQDKGIVLHSPTCHCVCVCVCVSVSVSSECRELVSPVKSVLENAWGLPVECSCADAKGNCQGKCLGPVVRCMGFSIALGGGRGGINHVQPAALKDDWSLRLGPSLMTPKHTYKGYLSGIFTGALANGRPWVRTWAGQIMSALAWLQAALLSGYGRGDSMRAMHRALHRAFAGEPHCLRVTVKAVYSISHLMPDKKCTVVRHVQQYLQKWAHWEGDRYMSWSPDGCRYTSWSPDGCAALRTVEVVWNDDWRALDMVRRQSCQRAECVCVCVPGDGWFLQVTKSRIVLMVQGTTERGLTGQGGVRDFLGHRPRHDLVFLHAGADTTSGPPHPLVPSDHVPAVLQKGA